MAEECTKRRCAYAHTHHWQILILRSGQPEEYTMWHFNVLLDLPSGSRFVTDTHKHTYTKLHKHNNTFCWKWWLCGLRSRFSAAWLLGLQVQIPMRAWMFVSFVLCRVHSCLCDEPIYHSEESYRVCVCVCVRLIARDLETSSTRHPGSSLGRWAREKIVLQIISWVMHANSLFHYNNKLSLKYAIQCNSTSFWLTNLNAGDQFQKFKGKLTSEIATCMFEASL